MYVLATIQNDILLGQLAQRAQTITIHTVGRVKWRSIPPGKHGQYDALADMTNSLLWRGQFIAIEFTLNIFGVVVAYWVE